MKDDDAKPLISGVERKAREQALGMADSFERERGSGTISAAAVVNRAKVYLAFLNGED